VVIRRGTECWRLLRSFYSFLGGRKYNPPVPRELDDFELARLLGTPLAAVAVDGAVHSDWRYEGSASCTMVLGAGQ
jgi:hypothetical protein